MLVTAEARFGPQILRAIEERDPSGHDPLMRFLRDHPSLWPYYLHRPLGQEFVPPNGTADEPRVLAYVHQGRWLTACPFCRTQQHASEREHWFFCAVCMNGVVGSLALPVVWPEDAEAITAALLRRRFLPNQNWQPPETLADLERENDLYLKLPPGAGVFA